MLQQMQAISYNGQRIVEVDEGNLEKSPISFFSDVYDGVSHYFSAITSISKSSVVSLSFLEKAPSFAP